MGTPNLNWMFGSDDFLIFNLGEFLKSMSNYAGHGGKNLKIQSLLFAGNLLVAKASSPLVSLLFLVLVARIYKFEISYFSLYGLFNRNPYHG